MQNKTVSEYGTQTKKHYPDYDERLIWWDKRAKQLEDFEAKYSGNEYYFNLGNDKDFARLGNYVGQEITVFGSIGDILTKKFPYLMRIPHTKDETFEIVIHEENAGLLTELDMDTKKEYYVYIKGKLEIYKDKFQIVLSDKESLWIE
ncbi:MAG: hypothetical protein IPL53_15295 [Ignavibacteria bacterium]|nr:hypothetical protein [Ignavibacteria bacterium]